MDANMLRMQQEAAERVRKMQERARKFVDDTPVEVAKAYPPHEAEPPLPVKAETLEGPLVKGYGLKNNPMSFLSNFGQDQEQLLLLMLAVLLVKNKAPMELVLALLYLAM